MSNGWKDLRGYYLGDWVRPRQNAGHWRPLVDWTEVFPGHRAVDRTGAFELYRPHSLEADRQDSRRFSHGWRPLRQIRRAIRLLLRLLSHSGLPPRTVRPDRQWRSRGWHFPPGDRADPDQGLQLLARSQAPLRLNYRCRPGGWIKVEILRNIPSRIHPDVDPVVGLTFAKSDLLQGDSLDQTVTWNGNSDLSEVGEMLAIRIRMFQAKIFAYCV